MSNLFRRPIPVTRKVGAYASGVWTVSSESDFSILASVQPADAEELAALPEGRRKKGAYVLYSDSLLEGVEENENNPDQVTLFGQQYEVLKVARWQNGIVSHYKYTVVRVEVSV